MKSSQKLFDRKLIFGLRKPLAFVYRDFINESSYKLAFVTQLAGIFFTTVVWFFLSNLFGNSVSPYLNKYGGDYFSFVLIGISFTNYLEVSLRSFSSSIRSAQTLGTLEAMLVTQTKVEIIIFSSSLYSFIMTSFRVFVYLLFGAIFFGLPMGNANYSGALLILTITIFCFSSLGIISASFIMVFKKGNPLNWIFVNLSYLLGGVLYPISVLPEWLKKISYLLPITYSLEGMRMALIKGYTIHDLLPNIIPLLGFTVVLMPLSMYVFDLSVKRAKIEGSLIQY